MSDQSKRHRDELRGLLSDHNGRVAMMEPFVQAHGLMPRDVVMRAEQQNARRAIALKELCLRYSKECQVLVDRHQREQTEERGAPVNEEVNPVTEVKPDAEQSEEE